MAAKPLTPMLTRSAVTRWEERVGEVVDELLAPLAAGSGDYDVIQDFALIPTVILAEMIGVPKDRQEDFRRWSSPIAGSTTYGQEDPATLEAMKRANEELKAYLEEEFDRHRREQPDDILTTMLQLPPEAGMSEAEFRSTISVLLLAGYDTTSKLLSNSLVVLERHPDQRRLVVDNPGLVPAAIEEILRWWGVLTAFCEPPRSTRISPARRSPRGTSSARCRRPPIAIPVAEGVPLRFDVQRPQKAHMGFGYGAHLWIGAWLARSKPRWRWSDSSAWRPSTRWSTSTTATPGSSEALDNVVSSRSGLPSTYRARPGRLTLSVFIGSKEISPGVLARRLAAGPGWRARMAGPGWPARAVSSLLGGCRPSGRCLRGSDAAPRP